MNLLTKMTRGCIGLVCFALTSGGLWHGTLRLLDAYEIGAVPVEMNFAADLDRLAGRVPVKTRTPDARYVALLGDSMMTLWKHAKRDHTVPKKLSRALRRKRNDGAPVYVIPFTLAGLGVDEQYAIADHLVDWQPDLVVLQLNLTRLSARVRSVWKREQLIGFIRPQRLLRALRLDLFGNDVTTDELLFRVGIVQLGAVPLWERLSAEQGRTARGFKAFADWVEWNHGSKFVRLYAFSRRMRSMASRVSGNQRPSAQSVKLAYGAALRGVEPDHSVLRVLAAAVESFRDEGIDVLVFINPINVEHFERLGVLDRDLLRHTVASAREVVETQGGRFADFHDIFPDTAFRDTAGHLAVEGEPEPHGRLGSLLADEILISLERREKVR